MNNQKLTNEEVRLLELFRNAKEPDKFIQTLTEVIKDIRSGMTEEELKQKYKTK